MNAERPTQPPLSGDQEARRSGVFPQRRLPKAETESVVININDPRREDDAAGLPAPSER